MKTRTEGIKSLLAMKHEIDLQAMATAKRAEAAARSAHAALADTLKTRQGDDPSAACGNDAAWAGVVVGRLAAQQAEIAALSAASLAAREAARLSFGRIEAFSALASRNKFRKTLGT